VATATKDSICLNLSKGLITYFFVMNKLISSILINF
jgi:hypothetical protein